MKSCHDGQSDEWDLFCDFSEWYERYGVSQIVDLDVAEKDFEKAVIAALAEVKAHDPKNIWGEFRDGAQYLRNHKTRVTREDIVKWSPFLSPESASGSLTLIAIWVTEVPFEGREGDDLVLTGGCYLCEGCEGLEDPSDCELCEGDPQETITVRSRDWMEDLEGHLEGKRGGIDALPSSFWA